MQSESCNCSRRNGPCSYFDPSWLELSGRACTPVAPPRLLWGYPVPKTYRCCTTGWEPQTFWFLMTLRPLFYRVTHNVNWLKSCPCVDSCVGPSQLKERKKPIFVSEKKGCHLCHNTFSEPDVACLPGAVPVHINCVAQRVKDSPTKKQLCNSSNYTWNLNSNVYLGSADARRAEFLLAEDYKDITRSTEPPPYPLYLLLWGWWKGSERYQIF